VSALGARGTLLGSALTTIALAVLTIGVLTVGARTHGVPRTHSMLRNPVN
jgi:hypothetical protein